MSKQKLLKTNAVRHLEEAEIPLTLHEYPHGKEHLDGTQVARLIGRPVRQVFKTLVCYSPHKGEHFVFVIPVAEQLDLKKAARAAGQKSMELLDLKDLTKVTGYVRGGCSPIGMKKTFPTFLDASAGTLETVIVSAGKIGHQVELAPQDLLRAARAQLADLLL